MSDTLIIVPAYNEGLVIGDVVNILLTLKFADIIVIDDGSLDNSVSQVELSGGTVISHPCNLGYGAALQTGYKYATALSYQYVIQFDADGQHNPSDIKTILDELRLQQSDVVIGSRYLGDDGFSPGFGKLIAIRFFQFIIRSFTGKRISDPTSGLRGLTRSAFSHYAEFGKMPADFPDADLIIDMLLHGYRVSEVPISHKVRETGKSMHSGIGVVIYAPKVLLHIFRILFIHGFKKVPLHNE